MAGRDHEEKRQFQRMQLPGQLQFRRAGNTTLFKGKSLDLSATGMRFITDVLLFEGDILQIVINSHHTQIAPLVAEGQVIRAAPYEAGEDQYEISVRFTGLQ